MNFPRRLVARFKAYVGPTDLGPLLPTRAQGLLGFVREGVAGAWQRGKFTSNREDLMAYSAVFACVSRIANDIAKLRIRLVEQNEGIWTEVQRQSPYWAVLRKPNAYQNRIQFIVTWLTSKMMFGNAYVLKDRDARGIVVGLHVLDPRRVTPLVAPSGDVFYSLGNDYLAQLSSEKMTVPASELIHDRGVTLFHPLVGVSPLYACAVAATQGNRIQENSATFFENMSRPSGVLSAPGTISDEIANRLKKAWEENYSGGKIGRLAVLGDGLSYQAMTINAVDSQLIQQLDWTVQDVARAFGMPLYKINSGPIPSNNNVEALEQQYYTGCLQVLIESLELCLDEGLELSRVSASVYGTEVDLDGLLRMDTATLTDSLGKVVAAGIMAPNEARQKLNLTKVSGGDTPYMQQQNWSLAQLNKRDIMVPDKPTVAAPPIADPVTPPALPDDTPAKDDAALASAHYDAILSLFAAQTEKLASITDSVASLSQAVATLNEIPAVKEVPGEDDDIESLALALIERFAVESVA